MTDRVRTIVVVLDHDYRDDDAEATVLPAIRMLRGVMAARLGPPVTSADYLAREIARSELRDKVFELFKEKP